MKSLCTYERPLRRQYLFRLIDTFKKIPNLLWIIIEDASTCSGRINEMLYASGIVYKYLAVGPTNDKGNTQKNLAIDYIRENRLSGVVYIADDDNDYNEKLFEEIRKTKKVSILEQNIVG